MDILSNTSDTITTRNYTNIDNNMEYYNINKNKNKNNNNNNNNIKSNMSNIINNNNDNNSQSYYYYPIPKTTTSTPTTTTALSISPFKTPTSKNKKKKNDKWPNAKVKASMSLFPEYAFFVYYGYKRVENRTVECIQYNGKPIIMRANTKATDKELAEKLIRQYCQSDAKFRKDYVQKYQSDNDLIIKEMNALKGKGFGYTVVKRVNCECNKMDEITPEQRAQSVCYQLGGPYVMYDKWKVHLYLDNCQMLLPEEQISMQQANEGIAAIKDQYMEKVNQVFETKIEKLMVNHENIEQKNNTNNNNNINNANCINQNNNSNNINNNSNNINVNNNQNNVNNNNDKKDENEINLPTPIQTPIRETEDSIIFDNFILLAKIFGVQNKTRTMKQRGYSEKEIKTIINVSNYKECMNTHITQEYWMKIFNLKSKEDCNFIKKKCNLMNIFTYRLQKKSCHMTEEEIMQKFQFIRDDKCLYIFLSKKFDNLETSEVMDLIYTEQLEHFIVDFGLKDLKKYQLNQMSDDINKNTTLEAVKNELDKTNLYKNDVMFLYLYQYFIQHNLAVPAFIQKYLLKPDDKKSLLDINSKLYSSNSVDYSSKYDKRKYLIFDESKFQDKETYDNIKKETFIEWMKDIEKEMKDGNTNKLFRILRNGTIFFFYMRNGLDDNYDKWLKYFAPPTISWYHTKDYLIAIHDLFIKPNEKQKLIDLFKKVMCIDGIELAMDLSTARRKITTIEKSWIEIRKEKKIKSKHKEKKKEKTKEKSKKKDKSGRKNKSTKLKEKKKRKRSKSESDDDDKVSNLNELKFDDNNMNSNNSNNNNNSIDNEIDEQNKKEEDYSQQPPKKKQKITGKDPASIGLMDMMFKFQNGVNKKDPAMMNEFFELAQARPDLAKVVYDHFAVISRTEFNENKK